MSPLKDGIEPDADIELTEVGLLDTQENGQDPHTWYSANGRGYSVNGSQTETRGDVSHIGAVLGERFYSRERLVSPTRRKSTMKSSRKR